MIEEDITMTIEDWNSLVKEGRIFVVHGHDETNLRALQLLINDRFKLNAVILNQLPDQGRTVIEKFEEEAATCCYAVVLLTPDDHVQDETGESVWQPRQNVMFELGWLCGRLGRKKILFIKKEGTRLPSDFEGVLQKQFRESVTEDQLISGLEIELRSHGIIGG